MAHSPTHNYAVATNYDNNTLGVFVINATTGSLTEIGTSPHVTATTEPWAIATHPNGKWIYVGSNGGSTIQAFSINTTTGALAAALRNVRASSRENLIPALLNLREEKPFKQIRERLNQAHLMVVEASPQREADARRVLRELTALFDRIVTQPDRVALENGAVHRSLSVTKAPAYEADLYGVFPELRRIDNF